MRINYNKIAFSLLLCAGLFSNGQVAEAVSNAGNSADRNASVRTAVDSGSSDTVLQLSNNAGAKKGTQAGAKKGAKAAAKTNSQSFTLVDQATKMAVESYTLPAGWKGTGQVLRPPMQSIYWQSYFKNPQTSSVGFRFFTVSSNGIGPYRFSPMLQNDFLAYSILQDVQNYMKMPLQDAQVVSSDFSPNDTPQNRQIIQFMQSQNRTGLPTNYAPLQYHAVVSMTCNGKPYKADIISNLLCWEQMNSRVAIHNVTVQNSYGVVAPVTQIQNARKIVGSILASRRENPQWVQYGLQYNNQQAQQSNAHYDNMNRIIQDKNNHINNVQQQMNQNTADTMDRVRQGQHEMITETTDVANPYNPGTTITTDNNYDHGWTNSQGQVINTNSVLFNPNENKALNDVEWTQIK